MLGLLFAYEAFVDDGDDQRVAPGAVCVNCSPEPAFYLKAGALEALDRRLLAPG
ncbi:MAG: hypothetical protein ACREM8_04210 [Vulcanimicrobiaceae bacterium]